MEKIPEGITLCNLEVVVMPIGEVLCCGKRIGRFEEFKWHLEEKEK